MKCFPDHSFLKFAIADHDKCLKIQALPLGSDRKPQPHRQPHPERSGRSLQTRQFSHIRMALEPRISFVEGLQLFDREEAAKRHGGVEANR